MLANVGPVDRALRIAAGLGLIVFALIFPGDAEWGWVGVVPLLSGSARHCPVYAIFGFSTCSG